MTPHVQVKLLQFDALVAAFRAAKNVESYIKTLRQILILGQELRRLSTHITNSETLAAILNSILRADAAISEEGRRRGIVFKD